MWGVMLVTGFWVGFVGFCFLGCTFWVLCGVCHLFLCLLVWRGFCGCCGCFVLGVECSLVLWIGILFCVVGTGCFLVPTVFAGVGLFVFGWVVVEVDEVFGVALDTF